MATLTPKTLPGFISSVNSALKKVKKVKKAPVFRSNVGTRSAHTKMIKARQTKKKKLAQKAKEAKDLALQEMVKTMTCPVSLGDIFYRTDKMSNMKMVMSMPVATIIKRSPTWYGGYRVRSGPAWKFKVLIFKKTKSIYREQVFMHKELVEMNKVNHVSCPHCHGHGTVADPNKHIDTSLFDQVAKDAILERSSLGDNHLIAQVEEEGSVSA